MAENQSKKQDKQYQISMMVTDEVIRDFGIRQEDVTWRRIGNRKCRVVMVDASEEEHKAYMAPIWAEIKREDRDGRCMVKGKNDRLIRCPESNRCEECKHFSQASRERNKPASLSVLMDEGAEPIAERAFEDDVIYETILEDLIATPILTYGDIETLQELCRQLRHAGAKSDASRGCGVHIHIGAQGHTPQSLRNLANIMASHESLIAEALKLDRGRMSRYCRTVDPRFLEQVNRRKPRTMSQLADIWYTSNGASCGRSHHYNDSRYHMLNLHATFTKGTVEFRLFQFDEPTAERRGGIHAGQLKSYIQLCLALSQMAKNVRTASPKPQQNENPKYAMRTWLLRLGFIGEEFATARDFLTRNLTGDTAFRHGRAAA